MSIIRGFTLLLSIPLAVISTCVTLWLRQIEILPELAKLWLFIFGYNKITTIGQRSKSKIVVFNHPSYADAFVLMACIGPIYGLIWETYYKLPLVGWISRVTKCIVVNVDRKDTVNRLQKAFTENQNMTCVIAPEGGIYSPTGIYKNSQLHSFKSGAFINDVPIQPVILVYKDYKTAPYGINYRTIFKKMFEHKSSVELHYLPDMVRQESESYKEFKERTQNVMQSYLDSVMTN